MGDHVFICYSRKDEDFVLKLAENLKKKGVPIWLDQWDIPSGANWDRTIEKNLNECTSLLIILSPASVESDEVQSEWRSVLDEKKVVVPILYQKCQMPFRLKPIQYIDFTSRSPDDEKSLEQIFNALGMTESTLIKPVAQPEQLPTPPLSLNYKNRKVVFGFFTAIAVLLILLWFVYPKSESLIYSGDFSSWENSSNSTAVVYENGKYRLTEDLAGADARSFSPNYLNFRDFTLEVNATKEAGPQDNEFGVLIRVIDPNNYYGFIISSNGQFRVVKLQNYIWQWQYGLPWTKSSAIETGNTTNRLKVVCKGDKFSFYANDVKLADYSDSSFASGYLGLCLGTHSKGNLAIAFDNLKVWAIK